MARAAQHPHRSQEQRGANGPTGHGHRHQSYQTLPDLPSPSSCSQKSKQVTTNSRWRVWETCTVPRPGPSVAFSPMTSSRNFIIPNDRPHHSWWCLTAPNRIATKTKQAERAGDTHRPLLLETSQTRRCLPASISWHCWPKTVEKVTGPAGDPAVATVDSMALLGSLVLGPWLWPAPRMFLGHGCEAGPRSCRQETLQLSPELTGSLSLHPVPLRLCSDTSK